MDDVGTRTNQAEIFILSMINCQTEKKNIVFLMNNLFTFFRREKIIFLKSDRSSAMAHQYRFCQNCPLLSFLQAFDVSHIIMKF